jgi:hypothetical protein
LHALIENRLLFKEFPLWAEFFTAGIDRAAQTLQNVRGGQPT